MLREPARKSGETEVILIKEFLICNSRRRNPVFLSIQSSGEGSGKQP